MIKQIPIEALTVGMFVDDLNCGWLDHPFARSRFAVDNAKTLQRIQQLPIKALYIDTRKGLDVADAPTREEVQQAQQQAIDRIIQGPAPPSAEDPFGQLKPLSLEQELPQAQQITSEARRVISQLMDDVRSGRELRIEQTQTLVDRITRSLVRNSDAMLALGRIRSADHYTFEHSINVGTLLVAFAVYLELPPRTIRALGTGGMLHDLGKVKIDEQILNKPASLTEAELATMRTHATLSRDLLAQQGVDKEAIQVAYQHHERYDGSGYPQGLRGDQISLGGHMAAIVDVYDALTTQRCYRDALAPTEVLRRIYEWSHHHFHPQLAQQFIRFVGVYPCGAFVQLASGYLAMVIDRGENRLQPKVKRFFDTRQRCRIPPEELDLSSSDDRIKGYADLTHWQLEEQVLLRQLL